MSLDYPKTSPDLDVEQKLEQNIQRHMPTQEEEREMWKKLFPDGEFDDRVKKENDLTLCLELGDKKLLLYTMDQFEFDALLINKDEKKISGSTTKLFEEADKIMQNHANDKKHRYHFDFATKNQQMVNWAQTAGKKIFNWHAIKPANQNSSVWIFSKKYLPQPNGTMK